MRPELRSVARRILHGETVMLHVGPGLLAGTSLPADALARAVWGEPDGQFSVDRFRTDPEAVWADWLTFWHDRDLDPSAADPLPVHHRIAELVDDGFVSTVLTENVFGQLDRAGVSPPALIELHGRADRARCEFCDREYEAALSGTVGHRGCAACGGTLGPGIILAGEEPDRRSRIRATARAADADTYLAVGTRLSVDPTAEVPVHALDNGAELVFNGATPSHLADRAVEQVDGNGRRLLSRLKDTVEILR